ncbi:class I SAM-dependent methyltransferase [Legionella israelensis]|uniref:class I SAM-dependent methyltransferase n=1 Tax=Legionella israelensis TaxID=454 RepID=UPI00163D5F2D|nr:class I SAM-dependent methyltransferase [Legionella israelensis]
MEKNNITYKILSYPKIYRAFQQLVSGKKPKSYSVIEKICNDFIKINGRKPVLLDLGCGEGKLCDWIHDICDYYGVDYSDDYLSYANEKYKNKGKFIKFDLSSSQAHTDLSKHWDIIISIGLLHHLANDDVLKVKKNFMDFNPNAIIFTIDPVLLEQQNIFAKFIVSRDRGSYVRKLYEYQELLKNYQYHLDNFCRIPYNHILFYQNIELKKYL